MTEFSPFKPSSFASGYVSFPIFSCVCELALKKETRFYAILKLPTRRSSMKKIDCIHQEEFLKTISGFRRLKACFGGMQEMNGGERKLRVPSDHGQSWTGRRTDCGRSGTGH
jgi:hypothetical protein